MNSYLVTHWIKDDDGDINEKLYRFDDMTYGEVDSFVRGLKENPKTDTVFLEEIT